MALLYISENFFYFLVNRTQLHSYICFYMQAVALCFLPEIYGKNLALAQMGNSTKRSFLMAFTDNCGYSSLILHKNSTGGRFKGLLQ